MFCDNDNEVAVFAYLGPIDKTHRGLVFKPNSAVRFWFLFFFFYFSQLTERAISFTARRCSQSQPLSLSCITSLTNSGGYGYATAPTVGRLHCRKCSPSNLWVNTSSRLIPRLYDATPAALRHTLIRSSTVHNNAGHIFFWRLHTTAGFFITKRIDSRRLFSVLYIFF